MQDGQGIGNPEPESPQEAAPLPASAAPAEAGPVGSAAAESAAPPASQGLWFPPARSDYTQPGAGGWAPPQGGQTSWDPTSGDPGQAGGGYAPPGGYAQYGQPGGYGGGFGAPGPGNRSGRFSRAFIYLVVAVLAAGAGAGAVFFLQHGRPAPTQVAVPDRNFGTCSINEPSVVSRVEPGVVDITSQMPYSDELAKGTGMVLSATGLVLTNNHVVTGATKISVTTVTNGHHYRAEIVGTDATDDVALLKLTGASDLATITTGNSDKVTRGTPVVAIGNLRGRGGTPTAMAGCITHLNQDISASDPGAATTEHLTGMLETDAPIGEGDSGGPLANSAGQVIGMDTAANQQFLGGNGTNLGYAIPINHALAIAHLITTGHSTKTVLIGRPPFIGITIASNGGNNVSTAPDPKTQFQQLQAAARKSGVGPVDSSRSCMTANLGDPVPSHIASVPSGTLIAGVFCRTPADVAGMKAGDVIVSVGGHPVSSPASLRTVMGALHPGQSVPVTWVTLDGLHKTASVLLAEGPAK
ncbi:MAG TPA: trypsin-like peptidase domain-containing protein [Streptosporangiaceae bacterium]|nr:trypsin-like peptidase domain-containing protein [Streptosporangiaceae bacterium]